MTKDFAVFILTHGRPDAVITYKTLLRAGYTGKIFIIIDNEDKTADQYYKHFGDKVIMFDKKNESKTTDVGDNFNDRRSIVYARNACFDIAKKLNIKYFMQLDDDYSAFQFRINSKGQYPIGKVVVKTRLDKVFTAFLNFYKKCPSVHSIAMSQGGDFIGGAENSYSNYKLRRKCMNTFICSTDRPFQFVAKMNDDVTTYTSVASRGFLFFTSPLISINQHQTQQGEGGMTDIYMDQGTYIKSFYSVMFSPSSVKVRLMGIHNKRLHHSVNWNNAVPVIIEEKYKK